MITDPEKCKESPRHGESRVMLSSCYDDQPASMTDKAGFTDFIRTPFAGVRIVMNVTDMKKLMESNQ